MVLGVRTVSWKGWTVYQDGAIKTLTTELEVDGYNEEDLLDWVFETWKPARYLNKADEEF